MTVAPPVPYDDQRSLLAAALLYREVADVVLDPEVLSATDFTHESLASLYTAMRAIHAEERHGPAALLLELERREWAHLRDEVAALATVLPWTPTSEDVATWIKALQDRRELLRAADRQKKAIAALVGGDEEAARRALNGHIPQRPVISAPPVPQGCPVLPSEATAIFDEQLEGCAPWLDSYIAFARRAAPMTPYAFHEAAGLMAASIAVARRLVIYPSTTAIYPNLFVLFLADSTIYSKTTGLRVLKDLFIHAGLEHLMLPQRMTPEAFVQELGTMVPSTLQSWDETARAAWLRERGVAAQRGWVLDEASRLFDSFKRDFNTGLLPLMLDLYECPTTITEQTISRGRITVSDAYLSFFGAATPAAMNEHMTNRALWVNGLWARFVLIVPDERPDWTFFPPTISYPGELLRGLRQLATLFPMPTAEIVTTNDNGGREQQAVVVRGREPPSRAVLDMGVWQAWEAYCKATRHTLLLTGDVPGPLNASYGRLGIQAMKVALLLAALDSEELPVHVGLRHFARAQMIVEGWRGMLHQLWGEGVTTEEAQQSDKVLALLAKASGQAVPTRDIYRPLNMASGEVRATLDELAKTGQVERIQTKAANGRNVEAWRMVTTA